MPYTRILLALSFLSLAACAPSKESLLNVKANEVTSIVRLNVNMDGTDEGFLQNACWGMFKDANGKMVNVLKDRDTGYYVMKTPAGRVELMMIRCMAYKVLYNKTRRFDLANLYFTAEPGYINYAGDLRADWTSDRVNVGDFLFGGDMTSDNGAMQIISQNHMDAAQNFMVREFKSGSRPFKQVNFVDHPLLTK